MQRTAIIIPAYNASRTIAETLKSLQSCPGIELIGEVFVCDDASTDNTVEAALKLWQGPPELRIIRNSDNLGERATVNRAIAGITENYDWVLILHADDVVKQNWLSLYSEYAARAAPEVASICSSYDCWYPDRDSVTPGEDDFSREVEIIKGSRENVIGTLAKGCWWHISGCAIRVAAFREIGEFRPDMPQLGDFEWLLRLLKAGYSVVYIPRTTLLYRCHAGSISSTSFRFGRDLLERISLFRQYHDEGYLDTRAWNAECGRILYLATRRLLKRVAFADIGAAMRLLALYPAVKKAFLS